MKPFILSPCRCQDVNFHKTQTQPQIQNNEEIQCEISAQKFKNETKKVHKACSLECSLTVRLQLRIVLNVFTYFEFFFYGVPRELD